ncbi:MAG: hypothetical protein AAGN66_16910 [Acidobacteriota bacterium]
MLPLPRLVLGLALPLALSAPALSAPALAESRCVLETDGVEHLLPHIYIAPEAAFVTGPEPVTQHWIFCTRHPIEPNPAYGDWGAAVRVAILQLQEDDRVEVLVAHDGRVRRAGMTWDHLQAESPHDDPDLPLRFEGSFADGRARGELVTSAPMKQSPTPWHDAELQWKITINLDAPILGADP